MCSGKKQNRDGALQRSVDLQVFLIGVGRFQKEMASIAEPVDDVEDEEEEWHRHQKESIDVDVVLPADPLVPSQLHLTQSVVVGGVLNFL